MLVFFIVILFWHGFVARGHVRLCLFVYFYLKIILIVSAIEVSYLLCYHAIGFHLDLDKHLVAVVQKRA